MNCPKCNSVIEQGSSFCNNCGFNLANNSSNLQAQPVMINPSQAQAVSNVPTVEPTLINNVPVANQVVQPSVPNQNISPVNNMNVNQSSQQIAVNNMNQSNQPVMPTNNNMNNMNLAPAGNNIAAVKANNNASIIIIVLVIAFVVIGICYFMVTRNASSDKNTNINNDNTVAINDNMVTVNGLSGNVPKNWSFVSGQELGIYNYDSVFINDSQNSFSLIETSDEVTYTLAKQNINSFKANMEAKGMTNLDYKFDKKNGIEYTLFEGLFQGVNYLVVIRANGAGIICAEGAYDSASDLNTIVDFITSLKSSTGVKAMNEFTSPNFNSIILGK
mgnify:FL=1